MAQMEKCSVLTFYVNGTKIEDASVDPEFTLLKYLREKLKLPGTKLGCGEGGCGACTVMISEYSLEAQIKHYSINACLYPIVAVHGKAVTTVEGIGTSSKLHPAQERLAKAHGSQCGFCTPGFVMSMYTLLRNNPSPSLEVIEENLIGNLCRCTGYRPIIEGYRTFAGAGNGCGKENCCMNSNTSKEEISNDVSSELFHPNEFVAYDPSQDLIFPPDLKINNEKYNTSLVFLGSSVNYYRPTTLKELLEIKKKFPHAKLAAGNTEIGVEVRNRKESYPIIVNPNMIKELQDFQIYNHHVLIGATVSLSAVEEILSQLIKEKSEWKTRQFSAIVEMLRWFAGRQIRNVATFGGNVVTGSPISDLIPILVASKSEAVLQSFAETRRVIIDRNFFVSYRKNIIRPDEILTAVRVPFTLQNEFIYGYKQARRRDDDIAIVNSSMYVRFKADYPIIEEAIFAFGGMGPTVVTAPNTTTKMIGKKWNETLKEEITSSLITELELDPSAPGGMPVYRRTLTASFFQKFYLSVKNGLSAMFPEVMSSLNDDELKTIELFKYKEPKSIQIFQKVPKNQKSEDAVGRPNMHISALKQVTGEAMYVDDIPKYVDELYGAFVLSTKAKAKIVSVDPSKALEMDGVHDFVNANDLSEERNIPLGFPDEEIFASKDVKCIGQVIGLMVADTQHAAQAAARKVVITYEDIGPPIITIEDAIEKNSLFGPWKIESGNIETSFAESSHTLEGEVRIGGQEHFYLETNAHIAIPNSEDEMTIISTTQSLSITQKNVAHALGLPQSKVTCKAKRLGGGFGGKEYRATMVALPVAVAAKKLKKPVRIMLDRDEDMIMTGGRHPFLARWKAGFDSSGIISAMEVTAYANCGYSIDLSIGVITRFVFSAGNAYTINNTKVVVHGCKTNLPSNTAFRGFGGPQGDFVAEDILANVANYLNIESDKVRYVNLANAGDKLHYGQIDEHCSIRRCWDQVIKQSDFSSRKRDCEDFNNQYTTRKRGISIIPTRFLLNFGLVTLNQGGAFVNIYTDGSVLLSHGGVEMGQGLYTKTIQVASRVLDIDCNKITIKESSTDNVPNNSPSAASMSSDIYGMAVKDACTILKERLEPFRKNKTWEEAVMSAYVERVSLSSTGYYKVPRISQFNFDTGEGEPFSYFSYGVAVTEVEIDCLTGDHQILRTDIVMDVGDSLNPAIDVGQIEGAFTQGMGLFTMEEMPYSPEGVPLARGPGAYKIPSIQDIPREFNVSLLRDSPNPYAIYSSRAVGEPPLFLAASVFFAIREAIGIKSGQRFDSPATVENIRTACQDNIINQISKPEPGTYKPWSIKV